MKIVGWSVLIIVLVLLALKVFFVGYYRISQNGMYPTLPVGSVLFTIRRPLF
jgi:signal peptidase I